MTKSILILIIFFTTLYSDHIHNRENKFIIVYDENWAPYSYKDSKGKVKGILPELLNELLGKQLKIEIKNLAFPAKRAHHFVEEGLYDAFVINHESAEHNKNILESKKSLLNLQSVAFLFKDSINYSEKITVKNPFDFKKVSVCTLLSDEASSAILKSRKIRTHKTKTINDGIKMLKSNRADYFIGEKVSTQSYLKSKYQQDKIVMHPLVLAEFSLKLMINSNKKLNVHISKDLDALISKMKNDGSYFKLLEKIKKMF